MTKAELLYVALLQATEEGVGIHLAKFADMCIEWGQQHPQWISVEDELPKKKGWIILSTFFNSVACPAYYYEGEDVEELRSQGITHWMPLPQAPKEGGQTL